MNQRIAMRLAAAVAALAGATAQAQPVAAQEDRRMGYVPHRLVLQEPQDPGDTAEPLYTGGFMRPLLIHLPQDPPQVLLAPVEWANDLTSNSGLFDLVSGDDDEPAALGPRLLASERFSMRRRAPGHGRHRVHLEDSSGSGDSVGGTTPVPLPGSLALLLAPLLALLATGAGLHRRPVD